jgi:chitinase
LVDLGTFGGLASIGYGLNDRGQVVGAYYPDVAPVGSRAFLYSNGGMVDLGTFGGAVSAALAINNNGQITGAAYTANGPEPGDGEEHAFIYSKGTMIDLGTSGATRLKDVVLTLVAKWLETQSPQAEHGMHFWTLTGR